jgi:hypothetical protein
MLEDERSSNHCSILDRVPKLFIMSSLSITSTVKLNTGLQMPVLGFGVALSEDAVKSVSTALEAGYR